MFADGRTVWGQGFGAEGEAVGELCFNTAMTGYQEVMTDPSYAKQVIAFTFPHIGNVGANDEDVEAGEAHALGCLVREVVTEPSNYRASQGFAEWMAKSRQIGIAGVDTRALTKLVRTEGPPNIAVAHRADGQFDLDKLQKMAADWPGLEGMDLAKEVSRLQVERWTGGKWAWGQGYELGSEDAEPPACRRGRLWQKRNIFRLLVEAGARVTVVPAQASFDEIMGHKPDGFFLSNGLGDPAATGEYAVPVIRSCSRRGSLCSASASATRCWRWRLAARRRRCPGPPRANHPVKRLGDGQVEITSMNHGFAVEREGCRECPRDARVAVRRVESRDRAHRPPGVQRPVPSRGEPGADGQLLPVREVCWDDAVISTAAVTEALGKAV